MILAAICTNNHSHREGMDRERCETQGECDTVLSRKTTSLFATRGRVPGLGSDRPLAHKSRYYDAHSTSVFVKPSNTSQAHLHPLPKSTQRAPTQLSIHLTRLGPLAPINEAPRRTCRTRPRQRNGSTQAPAGNRQVLQEGRRRRGDLRGHPREDTTDGQSLTEREARRLTEKGDQEAPAVARPDQDMGDYERDQGQEAATRSTETD